MGGLSAAIRGVAGALAAATLLAHAASSPAAEVSYARLVNADAEAENWLLPLQNYSGHRYSRLNQINRANVRGLRLAFAVPITSAVSEGRTPNLENHPLVDGGLMYFDDGRGRFYKIDVRSGTWGQVLWAADASVSLDEHNRTRGMAMYGDALLHNLADGRVVAIDRNTGEFLFDRRAARIEHADGAVFNVERENFAAAPLPVDVGFLVGQSGGDAGNRGWLALLDHETGAEKWRTYVVPGPGKPGHETWADTHNAWKTGGGGLWSVGTYDAEQRLTVWGSGNPLPMFDPEYRPGDNLYTVSAIAFDIDTGGIRWYFQYIPNESWDYDEQGIHMLIDVALDGEPRKAVSHFGRNGFYYHIDRTDGRYMGAIQYVEELNWTRGLDPKSGKPIEYDPSLGLQTYVPETRWARGDEMEVACPSVTGGVRWQPPAYNPVKQLVYSAGRDGCGARQIQPAGARPLTPQGGIDRSAPGGLFATLRAHNIDNHGLLTAIDTTTQQIVAQFIDPYENSSGILATAGGLIFTARRNGEVVAHDDETLEPLWSWNGGIGFKAPPIAYAVDGKQYIAIIAGRSGLPSLRMTAGAMLWVFSL